MAFFLQGDQPKGLVTKLLEAEAYYKTRAPDKGMPHPLLNKKSTIMAGLLNWVAAQDYTVLAGTQVEGEAVRQNKLLAAAGMLSLEQQLAALRAMVGEYKEAVQLEREIGSCAFFGAKKDKEKMVLTWAILPYSPLMRINALLVFAVEAVGAVRAPGPAPKGPLYR